MSGVRQAKTAPEEAVAAWLREHQLRYRRNVRTLPGRPDFANQRAGFAIFVHGCFWHRHPGCPRATTPTRNRDFWMDKFAANVARDTSRRAELERAGLRTITIWGCEAEDSRLLDERLGPLLDSRQTTAGPTMEALMGLSDPRRDRRLRGGTPSDRGTNLQVARAVGADGCASIEGAGS